MLVVATSQEPEIYELVLISHPPARVRIEMCARVCARIPAHVDKGEIVLNSMVSFFQI